MSFMVRAAEIFQNLDFLQIAGSLVALLPVSGRVPTVWSEATL